MCFEIKGAAMAADAGSVKPLIIHDQDTGKLWCVEDRLLL
jgi:hypothetical protein